MNYNNRRHHAMNANHGDGKTDDRHNDGRHGENTGKGVSQMMSWLTAALVAIVALEGTCVAVTPWVTRHTVCFGVSVPASAQRDPEIRRLKIGYTLWTGSASAIAVLACIACAIFRGATGVTIAISAVSILLIIASFALILAYRKRTMRIKQERGWKATKFKRAAFLAENAGPDPLNLRWELLHLMPIAATIIAAIALYGAMPDRLATHANIAGHIDGWSDKSWPTVLGMPLAVQLIMAAAMTATHAAIIHSPRQLDPEHPSVSGYAYGRFARAWSIYALVVGLALSLGFAGLVPTYANWWSLGEWGMLMMVIALAMLIAALVLAVTFGQSGSLIWQPDDTAENGDTGDDAMSDDDDAEWLLGAFYFSRENPAIVVPKRIGVGYTLNLARPATWLICAALMLLVVSCLILGLAY